MGSSASHQVFVSHSSKDKAIADAVVEALEASGVRCWVAPRDILSGSNWAGSILKAVAESRLMVLIFSRHVRDSQHVCREVERAVHYGIAIAPIRVDEVEPTEDMEYFLSTSHWMDATGPSFGARLGELVEGVRKLLLLSRPRPNRDAAGGARAGGYAAQAPPLPPAPPLPAAAPLPIRSSLAVTGEAGACNVVLLGVPRVRMGRGRAGSDVVLRVLPRGEPNDLLSLHIAGKGPHLTLALSPEGLTVEDHGSANGTELDGQPVRGTAALPTDRTSVLNVAGALYLRLEPFGDDDEGHAPPGLDGLPHADHGSPDALWRLAERWRLRSLLIRRVSNLAAEEKYLMVFRWAVLGPGRSEIPLGPGFGRQGARLVRLGGTFWLTAPADAGPYPDGTSIRSNPWGHEAEGHAPHAPRPLSVGTTLACGSTRLEFTEVRQVGL